MRQQQNSVRLRGAFAAALTPMDEDLNVDTRAFAVHCQRLLDAGCHGLGVFGTTGEANSLLKSESPPSKRSWNRVFPATRAYSPHVSFLTSTRNQSMEQAIFLVTRDYRRTTPARSARDS